jgi:hypothetical protein
MENRINATLLAIKDRLSGLELYSRIYNESDGLEQQLQSKVIDAYDCFVQFCASAVEFYKSRRLCKLL